MKAGLKPNLPGERRGGRQKGTPNKATIAVKEALQMAFDGIGGVPALEQFGRDNPKEFYALWVKMLPQDVKLDGKAEIHLHLTSQDAAI